MIMCNVIPRMYRRRPSMMPMIYAHLVSSLSAVRSRKMTAISRRYTSPRRCATTKTVTAPSAVQTRSIPSKDACGANTKADTIADMNCVRNTGFSYNVNLKWAPEKAEHGFEGLTEQVRDALDVACTRSNHLKYFFRVFFGANFTG